MARRARNPEIIQTRREVFKSYELSDGLDYEDARIAANLRVMAFGGQAPGSYLAALAKPLRPPVVYDRFTPETEGKRRR